MRRSNRAMMMDLKERIAGHRWYHSIDLGNGIVTPGVKSLAEHRRESAAFFDSVDLAGRSVLDIGAWNGAYSFEAKRRGAARVLATDSYAWNALRGRETIELARDALGLDIELLDIDVMAITPERIGSFDVVLFAGIFYHLRDPIDGLARAASVARQVLIVETALDLLDLDRPAMAFYPGRELGNDPTNWWGPNPACVEALLKRQGFARIGSRYPQRRTRRRPDGSQRGVFHGWRSDEARRGPPDAQASPRPGGIREGLRSGLRRVRGAANRLGRPTS